MRNVWIKKRACKCPVDETGVVFLDFETLNGSENFWQFVNRFSVLLIDEKSRDLASAS